MFDKTTQSSSWSFHLRERVETLGPVSQTVDSSPHVVATLSVSQQSASPIFSGLILSFKNTIVTATMQHWSQCHNGESSTKSRQIKNIIKWSYYIINVVSMVLLGYWANIEPRAVIFDELNNKSSIFNCYFFKGFTFRTIKLFYATSLNSSATEKHMFQELIWVSSPFFFFFRGHWCHRSKNSSLEISSVILLLGGWLGGCWLGPFWLSLATGSRTHLAWPGTSGGQTHETPRRKSDSQGLCVIALHFRRSA